MTIHTSLRRGLLLLGLSLIISACQPKDSPKPQQSTALKQERAEQRPVDPLAQRPVGYRLAESIQLSEEQDGAAGGIELLEDERLAPPRREKWRGADSLFSCAQPSDPDFVSLCRSIEDRPLLPALIRLVDSSGAA